ncbi:hypothetical protein [Ruminococcus sp.]|uniref:hypothetical protein n=1 Tax=Ruminococcus sp. TaxID=41978 RepID=UPI002C5E28B0|nr:hypothetical protein [Ruminococcus sp.]HNZ99139.1 hypothetical protein [Ruminococcus sp.]HOH87324.1 hypothetical protein [Ruminococcus sp.]
MSKVLTTCFRFNMDNPEHAKAWDYLHNFDKDKIKSTNVAAITAVNDYFDRMGRLADDPYFETRQREERFVEQIVSEVGKAFIAEMPKFLASLMLSLNRGYPMQAVPVETENSRGYAEDGNPSAAEGFGNADNSENADYSGIDFDFIGG